jgi:hypothetical protein
VNPAQRPSQMRLSLAVIVVASMACEVGDDALTPIDPQEVRDQDLMTRDDYRPIPGINWADPSLEPERGFSLSPTAAWRWGPGT